MNTRLILQGFHVVLFVVCLLYALKHGAVAGSAWANWRLWRRIVRDDLDALSPWVVAGSRNIPRRRQAALAHTGMALLMLSTAVFNVFALVALASGK